MWLYDPIARPDVPAWPKAVPLGVKPVLDHFPDTNEGFIFTNLFTATLMIGFVSLRLCSKVLVLKTTGWEDCKQTRSKWQAASRPNADTDADTCVLAAVPLQRKILISRKFDK